MNKFLLLFGIFSLKALVGLTLPLSPDESYYWVWGQNLQLSYLDHPPAVAWTFWVADQVPWLRDFPRWFGILLSGGTICSWWLILKDYLSEQKLFWFLLFFSLTPVIGAGSWIITPDTPLMLFWSLSVYFYIRYLHEGGIKWAFWLGLSIGLGFLSKYQMILFVLSVFIHLTWDRAWSKARLLHGLFAAFVALVFFSPVLIWNMLHDWASFRFQISHGLGETKWDSWWTISYLLGQILLIFPSLFIHSLRASVPFRFRPLIFFGWTPICFFFLTSFRGVVEMNWPLMAHASLLVLAVFSIHKLKSVLVPLVVWSVLSVGLVSHQYYPWISSGPDKLNELRKYQALVPVVMYSPFKVYASSYQMASWLWAHTKSPVYKLLGMSRTDFYDWMNPMEPKEPQFYVIYEKGVMWPGWVDEASFRFEVVQKISDTMELLLVTRP